MNTNYKSIKSFEDACIATGTTVAEFIKKNKNLPKKYQINEVLQTFVDAINGKDFIVDFLNTSQRKYYPYFRMGSGSFGFSATDCAYFGTASAVGSRLCFETEEQAIYTAETFLPYYEILLINPSKFDISMLTIAIDKKELDAIDLLESKGYKVTK